MIVSSIATAGTAKKDPREVPRNAAVPGTEEEVRGTALETKPHKTTGAQL